MYLTIDLATPITSAYRANKRVKAKVLKYWPSTVTDGGRKVFAKLHYYEDGDVVDSTALKEIYKLVGTSVDELEDNSFSGVESAWFKLRPYKNRRNSSYSVNLVEDYLNEQSTLNEEYVVPLMYTQQLTLKAIHELEHLSNDVLIDLIEGGYESTYPVTLIPNEASGKEVTLSLFKSSLITYDTNINNVTFAAIYDTNNTCFNSTTTVTQRRIVPVYGKLNPNEIASYTLQVVFDYKFHRHRSASDVECSGLTNLLLAEDKLNQNQGFALIDQLNNMGDTVDPIANSELFYNKYIDYDAASQLKAKEFVEVFGRSFSTDFDEEENDKKWLSYLISFVVIVIAVVIGYLVAGPTGSVIGFQKGVLWAATFTGTLTLVLTLGSLVLSLLANAFGESSIAIVFRTSVVQLNKVATITGYVAMFLGVLAWINAARVAATEAGKAAAAEGGKAAVNETTAQIIRQQVAEQSLWEIVEAIVDQAITSIGGLFTNISLGESMNTIMKLLNVAFEYYVEGIAPIPDPGSPQEEVIAYNIDNFRLTQINFETYGFIDLNQQMENMPYVLTEYTIDKKPFSKYYQG